MDLLLQVSEKELEEFPEPPVDHTDQDKPDRTSTGGTQSSNISHQLQTQTQYSFKSFQGLNSFSQSAAQVQKTCNVTCNVTSTQLLVTCNVMRPVTLHTFVYRKEQCDQSLAHIPSLLTLQVEPNLKTFSRTLSPEALRYLHLGICIGKSHPHL